ncbi:MAG TPA: hypothetical protein VMZ22_09980 [Acidimicrobiales bacterium]|nr:hypothetical protein [Acidimicrobiales bacterium]
MKRTLVLGLAVALALVTPACKNKDDQTKALRAAIARTQHLAHQFAYTVTTPESSQEVRGVVEDDFRFKARVSLDGALAYDEVVHDDTLAVRFADPTLVSDFIRSGDAAAAFSPTDFAGVNVTEALEARRWVIDRRGAPAVAAASAADAKLGLDPVLDALTILDYVSRASGEAFAVTRFDPEDLNPTYRSSEDTFPKPQNGSGVERYDLAKRFLPPVAAFGGRGESAFPQTHHFRRMAIYVKDGRIIDIREAVDLRGRTLDDFIKYFRAALKEGKADKEVRDQYERLLKTSTREELSVELLAFLNEGLKESGVEPVVVRQMSMQLRGLGAEHPVSLPDAGVVRGSLTALTMSRAVSEDEKGSTDAAPEPVDASTAP